MGCDIHMHYERFNKETGVYESVEVPCLAPDGHGFQDMPFDWRTYGMFAFFAGVRNYSGIIPIARPRGLPEDVSEAVREEYESWGRDAHTPSYLTMEELTKFNYEASMEDRRCTVQVAPNCWDGGATAPMGHGEKMTWREFFGESFFESGRILAAEKVDRIVFWFDN